MVKTRDNEKERVREIRMDTNYSQFEDNTPAHGSTRRDRVERGYSRRSPRWRRLVSGINHVVRALCAQWQGLWPAQGLKRLPPCLAPHPTTGSPRCQHSFRLAHTHLETCQLSIFLYVFLKKFRRDSSVPGSIVAFLFNTDPSSESL